MWSWVVFGKLLLIGGMVFWLWLMFRALKPALKGGRQQNGTQSFLPVQRHYHSLCSMRPDLMYSNHTPLSIAEYWRWWVVHLWVEGFFEVFATVAIAYLCSELGFLKAIDCTESHLPHHDSLSRERCDWHAPPSLLCGHPGLYYGHGVCSLGSRGGPPYPDRV